MIPAALPFSPPRFRHRRRRLCRSPFDLGNSGGLRLPGPPAPTTSGVKPPYVIFFLLGSILFFPDIPTLRQTWDRFRFFVCSSVASSSPCMAAGLPRFPRTCAISSAPSKSAPFTADCSRRGRRRNRRRTAGELISTNTRRPRALPRLRNFHDLSMYVMAGLLLVGFICEHPGACGGPTPLRPTRRG